MMIEKYNAFIFDLDGTLYVGERIIPDADKTINYLRSMGKQLLFVSNKTTGHAEEYFDLLKRFGVELYLDEIITATTVIKKYLRKHYSGKKFFAIGEDVFKNEIETAGLSFTNNPAEVDVLIVTLDRTLNYEKLEIAARALENGARFFAANIDDTCPVENGEVMDAGSTISALEKRTHKKLEQHFGKPSTFMIEEIKRHLKTEPGNVLLSGDRIETDIALGVLLGADTALVSTGVKYYTNGNNIKPNYFINSVFDLVKNRM
ncbi:MAG: HAD-IIA family hydrolase [Ignavibacteriaceae bacterium]|nr:HAD-IIA family hydrolase [Ignavibacteriaceae bacterium]